VSNGLAVDSNFDASKSRGNNDLLQLASVTTLMQLSAMWGVNRLRKSDRHSALRGQTRERGGQEERKEKGGRGLDMPGAHIRRHLPHGEK